MEEIAAARPRDALAFSLLDNHVRLAILDSLYERTVEPGPLASDAAYSAVKSDVGVEDSGRFSYHLDKLTDWFVTKTDDGYRLAEPGRKVVRLRRTRTLAADPAVEAEPVDAACYRCEGDVEASYDAGYLLVRCRECEGLVDHPLVPEGTLSALAYPPSGVSEVGIPTAFERSHRRLAHYFRAMGDGFCPNCGRDVTVTFPPDDETRPGTAVGFSHVRYDGLVRLSCGFCGQRRLAHPLSATDDQEPMAAFFGDRGLEPGWDRMAAAMSWPVSSRDGRLAYETPDGTRFVVDDDLTVTRE